MPDYIIYTGKTRTEAEQKAQDAIKKIDPYRQPSLYSIYEHISGEWKAVVRQYGLD